MKRAIITGVSGQDGAYLSQLLLERGYKVVGGHRRTSTTNFWRLDYLNVLSHPNFSLAEFDLTDLGSCIRLIKACKPEEIYNLAAQSFVGTSFEQPTTTAAISGIGTLNLLEAIRIIDPSIRFYQASTSELYGSVQEIPQTEDTPFYPRSPYGVAKLFAHWTTVNYRESYGIFAASGILFNHESPLRGIEFVTRKITDGMAKIKLGHSDAIELGNLDAKRDWGFAKEYVFGMWLMLQADTPKNYVLATNRTETVRQFVSLAAEALNIDIEFVGSGPGEMGIDRRSGKAIVRVNPNFYRPAEVDLLVGNAQKAKLELGWEATTSLESLCKMMIEADLERNRKQLGRV